MRVTGSVGVMERHVLESSSEMLGTSCMKESWSSFITEVEVIGDTSEISQINLIMQTAYQTLEINYISSVYIYVMY